MIKLSSVAYSYGGDALLEEVSFSLDEGNFLFLTGPSGAGKSTLVKLCYMELLASTGRVEVFGRDRRAMSRDEIARARRRIGIVHQECRFIDHLTVADNVALPLEVAGRHVNAQRGNLDELLAWVGLKDRAQARPTELSGGERQRAALARAVIMAPDVVLADEPTGNVDADMSLRLLTLLIELNRMGTAILVATHDLALIRAAKAQATARALRISDKRLHVAGTDL